jgi:hypothetical protein
METGKKSLLGLTGGTQPVLSNCMDKISAQGRTGHCGSAAFAETLFLRIRGFF